MLVLPTFYTMPRVTRAAVRSNAAALDQLECADAVSLPVTPRKGRAVLGEVTGNSTETTMERSNNEPSRLSKKGAAKPKTCKGAKKLKKVNTSNRGEAVEDDYQSVTSSAVRDACEELRGAPEGRLHQSHLESPIQPNTWLGSPQIVVVDQSNVLSEYTAKVAIDEKPKTKDMADHERVREEDSFLEVVATRTPLKLSPDEGLLATEREHLEHIKQDNSNVQDVDHADAKEDSFVAQIVTRSAAKPVLRIEDCVEAIDDLDDEIDQVGEQLPAINKAVSSAKVRKQRSVARSPSQNRRVTTVAIPPKEETRNRKSIRKTQNGQDSNTVDTASSNGQKPVRPLVTTRVSSIHKAPFQTIRSTKPPTVSNFELPGDAVARRLKEQREARLDLEHKGELNSHKLESTVVKPVKSTKPPTRASFELPGEAIAAKLKEKREERLKHQQDGEAEPKKEFKARPVRLSQPPMVKPTATSKARISLAHGDTSENSGSKAVVSGAPNGSSARCNVSTAPLDGTKRLSRLSSLSAPKRTPTAATNASARPSLAGRPTNRMSAAIPLQRITSNGKAVHQTVRGKEVFERNKLAKEELEKQRKEKEEAAKRARAEAAERGRIASRQWAEKQKARKASTEKGSRAGPVAAIAA